MRALLVVLDSVETGNALDAAAYGDEGANTLGHLFAQDKTLSLPTPTSLGLRPLLQNARPENSARLEIGGSHGRDSQSGLRYFPHCKANG
ncbi:MAG: hypothetical protein ABI795_02295 [Chthoniobacterales bacterium]